MSSSSSSSSKRSPKSSRSGVSDRSSIPYSSTAMSSSSSRVIGNDVSSRSSGSRGASSSCCTLCEVSNQRVYQAMVITLHITALSELIREEASKPNDPTFKGALYRRNQLLYTLRSVRDHCDHTLLHLASCSKTYALGRYPVTRFPNISVIDVLLKCGFDPNARDCDGKTPAHLAVEPTNKTKPESVIEVVNRLLAGGAHVDYVDNDGNALPNLLGPEVAKKINFVKYQSLQCLCARVLVQSGVKFDGKLPTEIAKFAHAH